MTMSSIAKTTSVRHASSSNQPVLSIAQYVVCASPSTTITVSGTITIKQDKAMRRIEKLQIFRFLLAHAFYLVSLPLPHRRTVSHRVSQQNSFLEDGVQYGRTKCQSRSLHCASGTICMMQFLFMTETIFFFLIVMCAIMGFTLFIFVSYHFYLIYKGQTTNERVKKND